MEERINKFFKKHRVTPDQIIYVVREDGKTVIHLLGGSSVSTFTPLKAIFDVLPQGDFVIVNKGVMLPYAHIASVNEGVYRMSDGREFVGRVKGKVKHRRAGEKARLVAEKQKAKAKQERLSLDQRFDGDLADTLLSSCYKILRVDLTENAFVVLKDDVDRTAEERIESLSEWTRSFAASGRIHPEDVDYFLRYSSREFMLDYFAKHEMGASHYMRYRRLVKGEYRWALMEIVSSLVTQDGHLIANLYVRDVQNSASTSLAPGSTADDAIDVLTGLRTNESFLKKASEIIAADHIGDYRILCSDIDNFKYANERLGVDTCDSLLKELAGILQASLPGFVMGGRIMGDSFCFLLRDATFDQISTSLAAVVSWERKAGTKVSFGVAKADQQLSFQAICSRARMALKKTKGVYDVRAVEYTDDLAVSTMLELQLTNDAEQALSTRQFKVVYQPKIDVQTLCVVGAEALVRWIHPTLGNVNNSDYIYLFERSGLVSRLDEYVCHEVCKDLSKWTAMGLPQVPVSVNLSRFTCSKQGVSDLLCALVDSYELPHDLIHFELTESAFVLDHDLVEAETKKLRAGGFQIELDDFGTGYSSISSLATLSLDTVKLDKGIIDQLFTDAGARIVESVIELSKSLGMATLAEGVEQEEQYLVLKECGCDSIQGFYFSVPLAPKDYQDYLALHR